LARPGRHRSQKIVVNEVVATKRHQHQCPIHHALRLRRTHLRTQPTLVLLEQRKLLKHSQYPHLHRITHLYYFSIMLLNGNNQQDVIQTHFKFNCIDQLTTAMYVQRKRRGEFTN